MNRSVVFLALVSALALSHFAPALAAGEILLTHQAALAGEVTPGDQPGYPIHLTKYGVYQFGGLIHPPAEAIGIAVTSSEVTIDLNGFRMHGSGAAWHGIVGSAANVTIRNGTITGFLYDGVNGTGAAWIVESMRVAGNGRRGVSGGDQLRVTGSTVFNNGSVGIYCGVSCHIEGNSITNNGLYGITILTGLVIGNTIADNSDFGIFNSITGGAGFGHNFLRGNNGVGDEVTSFIIPLSPNACSPPCP